jgi:archaellum component FlaC
MTIEIALLISGVSLAFGIYQGVSNMRRNNRADDKSDATQLTTVIVKLENIGNDVSEIKNDMRNVKDDMKDINVRLVKMEQQVKVLNKTVFSNGTNE